MLMYWNYTKYVEIAFQYKLQIIALDVTKYLKCILNVYFRYLFFFIPDCWPTNLKIWNNLPADVTSAESLSTFHWQLKTSLFLK